MKTVIVDGDNILRALGFRSLPDVESFLQRLEIAAVEKDWEATAVFDGSPRYLPRESGPLVVRYAVGKSADSVIERMVYQISDRAAVVVVTQDRAEADLVRGLGAWVWSAEHLREEMG